MEVHVHGSPTAASSKHTLIVFMHGNGLTKSCYRETVAALGKLNQPSTTTTLHCLSMDLPGHGTSPLAGQVPDNLIACSDFAVPIVHLVEEYIQQQQQHITFHKRILVAHSMGCQIGLFVNISIKFDHAILMEPIIADGTPVPAGFENPMSIRTKTRRRTFPSFQSAFDTLRPKGVFAKWEEACVRDYVFNGGLRRITDGNGDEVELCCSPVLESRIYNVSGNEVEPLLKLFRFESVLVLAGLDSYIPQHVFRLVASKLQGARFEELAGVDHVLMCERPALLADIVHKVVLTATSTEGAGESRL